MLLHNRFFAHVMFNRAPDDGGAAAPKEPAATPAATPAAEPAAATPGATPAAEPTVTPAAAEPVTPASTAAVTPAATPAAATPAAAVEAKIEWPKDGFPDDWKDRFVKGFPDDQQAKVRQVADKYASLYEAMRALAAADSKITELSEKTKTLTKIPGKDATPAEKDAFNKAWGVPEDPTKYEFKRGDDFKPSELDNIADGMARQVFKDLSLNQAQVDGLVKYDIERQQLVHKELLKTIESGAKNAENDLRVHFGVREFEPQMIAVQRYVDDVVKAKYGDEAAAIFDMRMADGRALGEIPAFIKFLAAEVVNPWMDDNGIPRGEGNAIDLEKRSKEIADMQLTNPKEYARLQPEYDKILGQLAMRKNHASRAA